MASRATRLNPGPLADMATWQATFNLVPRGAEIPEGGEWAAPIELSSPEKDVDEFAERGRSWSKDLQAWGPDDGNRFEIWREGPTIHSIQARFDLRGPIRDFAKGVLLFARRHDLVLHSAELNELIAPLPEELGAALRRSSAFRFVSDPEGYLRALPRNVG